MVSREDMPYSQSNVQEDYEGLDKLGIFSDVRIEAAPGDSGVVLDVKVKETLRYIPTISLAISDENGISIGGGLKSVNLLGSGIYLSAVARFGGATTLELILRGPYRAKSHFAYQFEFYHRDRDNTLFDFKEVADEFHLALRRVVRKRLHMGVEYSYQIIQSDRAGKTLSPDNLDHVSTLGLSAGMDTRDLWSNPGRGWENTLYGFWSGFLGGDTDFFRLRLDLRKYTRLGDRHVLAVFSMFTGSTGKVGENMAEWQTFGLGGSNTVRGWDLGSRYGKNEFINTVEYRYMALKPKSFSFKSINLRMGLQIAVFADFASAWYDQEGFEKSWIAGGGAGVRFIIPYVDMLRIDFGFGQKGFGVKVHVAGGEKPERQIYRIR
jgi:outer membrane protein assembly factor BamA